MENGEDHTHEDGKKSNSRNVDFLGQKNQLYCKQ